EPSDVPEDISAFEGYTLGGREYLVGTSEVYLWEDGQASCIFETPGDLRYDPILLCGEHVLLDGGNGEFYIFPLDPDNTVHPIHVTAALDTLEEYDGKNGATVTGYYPLLLDDYGFTWDALAESLADYNAAAYETTRSNAAECASQASDLIENGFASPEDPFSVSTRVYIQRADTLAFSFVEHQTMDNRVNRGAMDLKTGYNLDPADGHDLTLDEVIADEAALQAILLDNLVETGFCQRDEGEEFLLQIFRTRSLTSTDQFSWVLGYEGVSFYFNGNINFPYAPGAYKVTIPFAEYPDLFNSKYFTTPDRYAYDLLLDGYFSEEYQVQSEAGSVPLLLTTSASDGEEKLFVLYNDESYTIPLDGAPVSAALVHIDGGAASAGQPRTGGGSFLMVQTDDNGYLLDVIDLDTGCVEAWDFGEAVLPQNLLVNRQWDYAAMGPEPSSVWLSNPDCFSVLYYDQATSSYTVRGLYDFNGGTPRLLDVFRSSLAVG
ncbi:MAG: hypothetical protein IJT94_16815, partial [Oscillibacter sp.]|nr:hypothetical protein [Oscillibacter sp.]